MITSNARFLIILLIVANLCACSMHPQLTSSLQASVDGNTRLIEEQQLLLQKQSQQLEGLGSSQTSVVETLQRMQQDLASLPQAVNKSVAARKPSGKKKVIAVSAASNTAKPALALGGKLVVGRKEWVWLDLVKQSLKASIDTGSRSSTISAQDVQPFERNGEKWVSFRLAENGDSDDPNSSSDKPVKENLKKAGQKKSSRNNGRESASTRAEVFEAPLVRYVRIRSATTGKMERRPVVSLTLRMGSIVEDTEFTLTNRDNMLDPVLLGREFLRDIAIVDVARKYTQPKPDSQTVSRR